MSFEQEKMIVGSLPSLYPLKKFEEEAINALVSLSIDDDTISRKATTEAIEKCHKQCCRIDSCGDEWIHYETTLNEVESIPPMPSNTSNALKALDDVNATQSNALDCISRKAAIELCDWYDNPSMREDLEKLRPARFSADTISRQRAIKEVSRDITVKGWKDAERAVELMKIFADRIEQLPQAQPESDSGRWERRYSRPGVYADLYWHCSKCGYKTDYQYANVNHRYCPSCGRKMEREVSDE